ncbi:MAG: alkaline phosphatase family protein, partial [Litorilinea sp.]
QPGQAQTAVQGYIADAVCDVYLDDPDNRLIVMWMHEPDASQHAYGLGAPQMTDALRKVDACVAQVLGELDRRGLRDQFDIFFISDHGHSTVRAHATLREYLERAAAEIGSPLPPLATASDYIYAAPGTAEPSAAELTPLVEWLQAQPWVGAMLAGRADLCALPNVFALEDVWGGATNARRPLLAISPTWSHAVNEYGVAGDVQTLTTQGALRSSHGSASPYDLHANLIANGPSFRQGVRSEVPTGAIDLLPTLLHILDISAPAPLQGRVWWELLAQAQGEPGVVRDKVLMPEQAATSGASPRLVVHHVGEARYLHGAFVGDQTWT